MDISNPNPELARAEYERLKAASATPEGYKELEKAWMRALNHEWHDEWQQWVKLEESAGNKAAGFAINLRTGRCYSTPYGYLDHGAAAIDATEEACSDTVRWNEARELVVDCRAIALEGYSLPAVMAKSRGLWDLERVLGAERKILEAGVGIPIFRIQLEEYASRHADEHAREALARVPPP